MLELVEGIVKGMHRSPVIEQRVSLALVVSDDEQGSGGHVPVLVCAS